MIQKNARICYFPGRESSYARNRVLIGGMREAGLTVFDCSAHQKNFFRYILSFVRFLRYKHKCDIVFVGFLGHFLVPIVKLCTRKKIIFDCFISIYQTLAFDRISFSSKSFLARLAKFIDRLSCCLGDIIFLDTNQHIDYFIRELNLEKVQFVRLLVGSDDAIMYPREDFPSDAFLVHFHGEYQSLHGTEHIIEAAKLLPHIQFQMIGRGKKLKDCITKAREYQLTNITFLNSIPYEQLPDYMARASVCLGIFGNTAKTQMVIPHKVYEALAMKKPVITADTPAIRELLVHEENVFLCQRANPKSLADAIAYLQDDAILRKKIAENGFQLFKKMCSPSILGKQVRVLANRLLE